MTTDRRDFLARLAAGTAATVAGASAFPSSLHAAGADALAAGESASQFSAQLLASLALPRVEWDTSWTSKLTGKHRAVFDTPSVDSGVGVFRSAMWQNQYAEVFKAAPSDINSVLVLRHDAIILAMAQPFWDEYQLGKRKKVTNPMTEKKTTRNPAMLTEADGVPPSFASFALDRQMAKGTIVLACGLAFSDMVGEVSAKHKIKGEEARAKAMAGLIPGIIMQPSGFFATTLAGQNGCIYVRAS